MIRNLLSLPFVLVQSAIERALGCPCQLNGAGGQLMDLPFECRCR